MIRFTIRDVWLQPEPLILEAGSLDRRSAEPPILFSPHRPDPIVYWLEHPSESPITLARMGSGVEERE
jgi:hypothetical protein